MLPRLSIYWKTLIAVVLVAALSVAVALSVYAADASWALVLGLAAVFAVAGAAIIATWVSGPLRSLLTWLAYDESRRLRLTGGDEWQTAAVLLTAWRRDARRRIAAAGTEMDRLRAVLATMADGVLVIGAGGRIQLANPAAINLLGVTEDQAVGRTVIECTMSADLDEAVRGALATSETRTATLDLLYPEPRRIQAVVSASGEEDDRAAVAVLHDRTEAMRIDQVRRDFVANVSHELRTPVTGIQTIAENLLEGALEEPHIARHFLNHILQSSRRLVALVDDLLGLARAETRGPTERTPVPLGSVARSVVAALDPAITARDLDVGVDVPDDLIAWGEPESVRQVVSNLVDNAVKYTPAGGTVDVTAERADRLVRLHVADTGIGIPPEHQDRVFERFYRVDRARSREVGGTGLGLSIVKHLVENMGGTVSLVSEPGQGSTFTVTLPAPPEPEERPDADEPEDAGLDGAPRAENASGAPSSAHVEG